MLGSIRPGAMPARRAVLCRLLCNSAAFFTLFAAAVPAQTLVPNAHLDSALAPWAAFVSVAPDAAGSGAAPVWVAVPDVGASAGSGSARIVLDSSASPRNAAAGVVQCVDFTTPASVTFLNYGMAFQVPPATPIDGSVRATVEVRLFASAGCSGFIGGGMQGQVLAAAGVTASNWYRLGDTGFEPPGAPVTVASAEVRGYLRQTGSAQTASPFAIHVDHFVLVLNSTTPVELIRFNVD